MSEETDHPEQVPKESHQTTGHRKVHAVTFGLGVAALAGLVATSGATAAGASTVATESGHTAAVPAPLDLWHISCSIPF